ncbi:hypothetical protein ACFVZL_36290 [Streptomyces sp. NPDC058320]|uniref:hypothetical protein n=1 Tax=unclassified Streptomyces TaxID=2593676 RepID=UPI003642A91A
MDLSTLASLLTDVQELGGSLHRAEREAPRAAAQEPRVLMARALDSQASAEASTARIAEEAAAEVAEIVRSACAPLPALRDPAERRGQDAAPDC